MLSAPATECILALLLKRAVIPTSEPLLAELHLVSVSFFAFLLDLGVVGITFTTAGTALSNAHEEEGGE